MRNYYLLPLVFAASACADSAGPSSTPAPALTAIGLAHVCRLSDGAASCWGRGNLGQLGSGSTTDAATPVPVAGGPAFSSIAAGYTHTCGLDTDGQAWCWGVNANGSVGTEPIGSLVLFETPQAVSGDFRFTSIAGGGGTFCGTTTDGATACWGREEEGQLLNGDQNSTVPVVIDGWTAGRLDGWTAGRLDGWTAKYCHPERSERAGTHTVLWPLR